MPESASTATVKSTDDDKAQALRVGFRRERRGIAAVAGGFALGIVGIVGAMVWMDRTRVADAAESELRHLALAHSEITARTFEGVDILLRSAAEAAGDADFSDPALEPRLHAFLRERVVGSQVLQAIAVFDASGIMRAQSRLHPPPPVSIEDRDHFTEARDRPDQGLIVGQPAFNRTTSDWSLFVSRRLIDAQGNFAGVAVVTVDPKYFERVYGAINRGRPDSSIEMIRDDGTLLVRHLSRPQAQAYSAGDPVLREALAGSTDIRVIRGRAGTDGVSRVVAARHIENVPVYVAVSEREATTLEDWRRSALTFVGVAGAMLAALGVLTVMLIRQVSARETAFRANERSARQQTALLRAIIDNMPIGVSVVDPDLKVFAFNRTFVELLELEDMDLGPGDTLESVFRYNASRGEYGPGDVDALVEQRLGLARAPQPHRFERRRPSGQVIDIRGRPLADGTMVTTYADVTQRAEAEASLRRAVEAAEVASRAKSAFLASMSHELRTPLNAIIGFTEFIGKQSFGPLHARYLEYCNDVLDSARHLLSVINDILDMSKIEAGRYEILLRPMSLARTIERALAIARGIASDQDIEIATEIAPDLPDIVGDERAIKQVLLNLISNAIKFNKVSGRVVIRLAQAADGAQEIHVIDTGNGIGEPMLKTLFEPFASTDTSLSRQGKGTGLGLWISDRFVRLHGGTLKIVSQPGKGTTAIVTLPAEPPAAQTRAAD